MLKKTINKRQTIYFTILSWMLLLFTCFLGQDQANASYRYFNIDSVLFEIELLDDGSMLVTENLLIDFTAPEFSPWNGFFIKIPLDQETEIVDIVVSEHGIPYEYKKGSTPPPDGTEGVYIVVYEDDGILIDWSLQAYTESRLFQVSYKVLNAVTAHQDVIEVYRKLVVLY